MNRAFLIVLGPAAVVAVGYVLVLRAMGLDPGYWRLAGILVVLAVGFLWINKRARKKV